MNVIEFTNVTKKFHLRQERTMKELIPQLLRGKSDAHSHTVLDNVSLSIPEGQTIGIVGKNGAGKSTMMKLIAGVTYPSSGEVVIRGKVAPLIELGAGFHGELTGYENIYLNAAILGLHKKEVVQKIDNIVKFSELGEYIYEPVKRYSSGMHIRLGFSIAIHLNAPLLLIDEVLAVGDIKFQKKCLTALTKFRNEDGKTIVFVSHDEAAVTSFCDRAILLDKGRIVADGTPKEVLESYHQSLEGQS